MFINLSSNHNVQMERECHYLNPFLLSYFEAMDAGDISNICEEYPWQELAPQIVRRISDDVYAKTWSVLRPILNNYLGTEYSQTFWEYYGSYAYHIFINIYYERFIEIRRASEKHRDAVFMLPSRKDNYYIARNYKRVVACDADIIATIDWQIVDFLRLKAIIVNREERHPQIEKKGNQYRKNLRKILKKGLYKANRFKLLLLSKRIIICENTSISRKGDKYINRKFKHKIWVTYAFNKEKAAKTSHVDQDFRDRGLASSKFVMSSDFEKVFFSNIANNLFSCFLEDFSFIINNSNRKIMKKAICIIGNDMSEYGQMRRALVRENGGKIGLLSHCFEESFEIPMYKPEEYSDYVLKWSNEELFSGVKDRWYGNSRLVGIKRCNYANNKKILYVCQGYPKYMRSEWEAQRRIVYPILDFFRKIGDFDDDIIDELKGRMCYRTRDRVWKRDLVNYISQINPKAEIDEYLDTQESTALLEKMKEARVIICESVHTTSFFEAIALGIPVIAIDNSAKEGFFSKGMCVLCKRLEEEDIIVENGYKAAQIINKHYETINEWWEEPKRKEVINELERVIGLNNKECDTEWLEILLKEMDIVERKRKKK